MKQDVTLEGDDMVAAWLLAHGWTFEPLRGYYFPWRVPAAQDRPGQTVAYQTALDAFRAAVPDAELRCIAGAMMAEEERHFQLIAAAPGMYKALRGVALPYLRKMQADGSQTALPVSNAIRVIEEVLARVDGGGEL